MDVKDSVKRLYLAQQEKKSFESYYEALRKKEQLIISNYMFANLKKGEESFQIRLDEGREFYTNPKTLNITRVRRKKIVWDFDKIRSRVSKSVAKKIINKRYAVNDMEGLICYLKKCGVNPKKFKSFIDVEEEMNKEQLEQCYEMGELKHSDIKGCYKLELGEPFIQLREVKGNDT